MIAVIRARRPAPLRQNWIGFFSLGLDFPAAAPARAVLQIDQIATAVAFREIRFRESPAAFGTDAARHSPENVIATRTSMRKFLHPITK